MSITLLFEKYLLSTSFMLSSVLGAAVSVKTTSASEFALMDLAVCGGGKPLYARTA